MNEYTARALGKLVETAEVNDGSKPRFHGNGFVQFYIWRGAYVARRLHIWHPEFLPSRVENARIHEHRFEMRSHILMGRLRHISYELEFSAVGEHQLYTVVPAHDSGKFSATGGQKVSDEMKPVPGTCCEPVVRESSEYAAGSSYYFAARKFHDTAAEGHTMTVMEKLWQDEDGKDARVLGPVDRDPDNAFIECPYSEDDLWALIYDSIEDLRKEEGRHAKAA